MKSKTKQNRRLAARRKPKPSKPIYPREIKPRYMWATTAIHKLGDISRKWGDLCLVHQEDADNWYGNWVTGFGFIGVRFPKVTTCDLNEEQWAYWNGRTVGIAGSWHYQIKA